MLHTRQRQYSVSEARSLLKGTPAELHTLGTACCMRASELSLIPFACYLLALSAVVKQESLLRLCAANAAEHSSAHELWPSLPWQV
jgi:hypothetical protein